MLKLIYFLFLFNIKFKTTSNNLITKNFLINQRLTLNYDYETDLILKNNVSKIMCNIKSSSIFVYYENNCAENIFLNEVLKQINNCKQSLIFIKRYFIENLLIKFINDFY